MDVTDHNAMSMLMHLFLGLMNEMNYDKAEKKILETYFSNYFTSTGYVVEVKHGLFVN